MAVILWMSLQSLPVQSFNALIIPILRDSLYSVFINLSFGYWFDPFSKDEKLSDT